MVKQAERPIIRICGNCANADTPLNRGLISTAFKCIRDMEWVEFDMVCRYHQFSGEEPQVEIAIPSEIIKMGVQDVKETEDCTT